MKAAFKAFKQWLRETRVSCAKWLLDKAPNTAHLPDIQQAQTILFLRQDGKIGDFIVSSFVFSEIKRHKPSAKIGVLCSPENRYLFEQHPDIDHIHVVEKRGMWAYHQLGKQLNNQYDVVIEPTLIFRVRELVLLRAIGAPHNIGYLKSDYQIFNHSIEQTHLHYTEVYCKILNILGFEDVATDYRLPDYSKSHQKVADFLLKNHLNQYIALNFFGAARRRRFTPEHIRAILQTLTRVFPQQSWLLLGFPEVNEWLSALASEFSGCYVFAETESIFDNMALIASAKAVLSPDTAVVHIAVALDKPLIGLYSAEAQNFANWYPYSQQAQVLRYQHDVNEINPEELVPLLAKIV